MNAERFMAFQDLEGNAQLNELAQQVRDAEIIKDDIFKMRDYSNEWRIRYQAALTAWARKNNEFQDAVARAMP